MARWIMVYGCGWMNMYQTNILYIWKSPCVGVNEWWMRNVQILMDVEILLQDIDEDINQTLCQMIIICFYTFGWNSIRSIWTIYSLGFEGHGNRYVYVRKKYANWTKFWWVANLQALEEPKDLIGPWSLMRKEKNIISPLSFHGQRKKLVAPMHMHHCVKPSMSCPPNMP